MLVIRANKNSMPKDDRIHVICFKLGVASLAVITVGRLLIMWMHNPLLVASSLIACEASSPAFQWLGEPSGIRINILHLL